MTKNHNSFLHALVTASILVAFSSSLMAQQGTAKPADDLPDGPTPQASALVHPNGPRVVFDTSMGRITCQFYERQAPKAVANFIALAEGTRDWVDPSTQKKQHNKRYYDGTIFHRVIPEFMAQGGDPTGTGMGDPGYSFEDEFDPNLNFDAPGKLAMANSGPNTNGSQFFITEAAYESLNQHYTLFGQCDDDSVQVVRAITRVDRDANDKPTTPVVLKKVTIVRDGEQLPPNPAAASLPKLVTITPEVAQGLLLMKVPPVYPIPAKAAGISGTVVLDATIGVDGTVEQLKVVSGPAELQQSALDAVKQWHYRPYRLNGLVTSVETTVNVIYSLSK